MLKSSQEVCFHLSADTHFHYDLSTTKFRLPCNKHSRKCASANLDNEVKPTERISLDRPPILRNSLHQRRVIVQNLIKFNDAIQRLGDSGILSHEGRGMNFFPTLTPPAVFFVGEVNHAAGELSKRGEFIQQASCRKLLNRPVLDQACDEGSRFPKSIFRV